MEPVKEPYRQLLADDPPLSIDRVDSPWTAVPDLPQYNRRAFRDIKDDLLILKKACVAGQRPDSRGILVLGEAGAGKTHLLTRVARVLSQENPLLFVRRPTNEDAVAQHIWENILESLSQQVEPAAGSASQLDLLLARVFSRILIQEFEPEISNTKDGEQKKRWVESMRSNPHDLPSLLGQGEGRGAIFNMFRRRIINHLSVARPNADLAIARDLVTYCLVLADNKKRILRAHLAGHEIEETEAKELGLNPAGVSDDGTLSQASLQQARERNSLKGIQTLGELSTYSAPLILAFDQLEGLRNSQALTNRWGDTVRELFTMAPNFLVITCAFPSLWNDWFARHMDDSAAQRIAQTRVSLEEFSPQHGEQLLEAHLASWSQKHGLPTSLYPFKPHDVRELCAGLTGAISARTFLQAARTRFRDWLLEDESPQTLNQTSDERAAAGATRDEIGKAITLHVAQQEVRNYNLFTTQTPSEQSLFGRLLELARALLPADSIQESALQASTRVLPVHVRIHWGAASRGLILSVCNARGVAFTARVKNLLAAVRSQTPRLSMVLFRDERCGAYTPSMRQVLDEVRNSGGEFVELKRDDFARLMALHDCLVAAEEGDLTTGTTVIRKDQLLPYLSGFAAQPEFSLRPILDAVAATPAIDRLLPSDAVSCEAVDTVAGAPGHDEPSGRPTHESEPLPVVTIDALSELDTLVASQPVVPGPSVPVLLGFGKPIGRAVEWDISIRKNPHLMIVGLPGMDKTTCIVNICAQLASQGVTPIVFSYHEDIDAQLEEHLGPINRIEHSSLGFNPLRLSSADPKAHIDRAGMMRDIFAGIFPDLGEIQTEQIRQAIKQSYEDCRGRGGLASAAGSPRFRDFFRILQQHPKPDKGLMARLTELDDYGLFSGLSEESSILATAAPSVVSLHATQNEVVQRAFASLLFYRLYQEMFCRGLQPRITHAIVFDEAHRASRLKLLASMGKEGRKYGLSLILASQEAGDFSRSMYSAVANYLVLRVNERDARALAKNVASSTDARKVADELKQLPKHEAVLFQEGHGVQRIRLCSHADVGVPATR